MQVGHGTGGALLIVLAMAFGAGAQDGSAIVRADDGRWATRDHQWALADVSSSSALHGVVVGDSPDERAAIVTAIALPGLPLHVGDRVDEIQLPGIANRQQQSNPGYWPYQVWRAADFYRLASRCRTGCLVRLRGAQAATTYAESSTPGPLAFGYVRVGEPTAFRAVHGADGAVNSYLDAVTGEQFGPLASSVFGQR